MARDRHSYSIAHWRTDGPSWAEMVLLGPRQEVSVETAGEVGQG